MSRNTIAPGNHEKAWNDPPQLSFNATSSQSSTSRLKMMKKRIPVPLNSTTTNIPAGPSQKLANPPLMQIPTEEVCVENKIENLDIAENTEIFTDEKLTECVENLLNKLFSSEDKRSNTEDVIKRIGVLKDMWSKNQLHMEVQRHLTELLLALDKDDYDRAWSLHQSLIVDYTSDCSSWMSGIKTLITEGRHKHCQNSLEISRITDADCQEKLPLFLNPDSDKQ